MKLQKYFIACRGEERLCGEAGYLSRTTKMTIFPVHYYSDLSLEPIHMQTTCHVSFQSRCTLCTKVSWNFCLFLSLHNVLFIGEE